MITKRERSLMFMAFESGFDLGAWYETEGGLNSSYNDAFNKWLESEAAEGGITVEMLVDKHADFES